jgi:hypothetical protein
MKSLICLVVKVAIMLGDQEYQTAAYRF